MTLPNARGVLCAAVSAILLTGFAAAFFGLPACVPDMGALDNEEEVGRQERGRDPGSYWVTETHSEDPENPGTLKEEWTYAMFYKDVILSPDGETLLAMAPVPGPGKGYAQPGTVLVTQRLPAGQRRVFPEIRDIIRLNFSPSGHRAYAIAKDGRSVIVVNLRDFAIDRTIYLPEVFTVVDVTPDGEHLVLSNLPTTDWQELDFGGNDDSCFDSWPLAGASLCQFAVVELANDVVDVHGMDYRIRDIDFSPVNNELLLTYSHWEDSTPHAYISFFSPGAGVVQKTIDFPNCADELVVEPERSLALLSPVDCVDPTLVPKDPISVIDLEKREFVTNLPGLGPVVVTADGATAVGFTRRGTLESEFDYHDQETDIGLVFVNLDTLEWKIIDYGSKVPTYTLSPDGSKLIVYVDGKEWVEGDDGKWHLLESGGGLMQLSLADLGWKKLSSKPLHLDHFAWTADGESMYFLFNHEFFRLDMTTSELTAIATFGSPELMNLRPQQDYLILGEADEPRFYVLDRTSGYVGSIVSLAVGADNLDY